MPSRARQTRYAADDDGMVCLLLDVRSRARPNYIRVFSYTKGELVNLPYRRRDGRDLIKIDTPDAKRWAAISVPRWLANKEALHGKPDLPDVMSNFCRQQTVDTRTDQEQRDDAERALAQYVVDRENRYRRLPGQHITSVKGDRRNANIFT